MKRKVVVTMSLAYWADDKYFEEPVSSNEEVIALFERDYNEGDFMEMADEANVIKIEITEVKDE